MAGLDLRAKRRVRRRRQTDSGFFDSNCSNDIPSPDTEQRSTLEAAKENSKASIVVEVHFRFKQAFVHNIEHLFSLLFNRLVVGYLTVLRHMDLY